MSIAVSIFIEIAVFYFAIDAYGMMRDADVELDVIVNLILLFCKFIMLILFIIALLAGSLLPLAMMYIILSPNKLKKE